MIKNVEVPENLFIDIVITMNDHHKMGLLSGKESKILAELYKLGLIEKRSVEKSVYFFKKEY